MDISQPILDHQPFETGCVFYSSLSSELDGEYQRLADQPRYSHFIRIPERIVRTLQHLGVECDQPAVLDCLRSFYLFIGVIDDEIDSGKLGVGETVLGYLSGQAEFEPNTLSSTEVVTAALKDHIASDCYARVIGKLRLLYQEVINERTATSMDRYLNQRRIVGSLTAESSYLLIEPFLTRDRRDLCSIMQEVGGVGCLVDSVIDLRSDHRLGLLAFDPGLRDYARLTFMTLGLGLRLISRDWSLCFLFLPAIIDDLRDRLTRNQPGLGRIRAIS